MEPERKIEKLLRASAKKRRAEAGGAFKLHPATRRMLHGEVARRAPKPAAEENPLLFWNWFRPRWAVGLGCVLVVFIGAALFLSAWSQAKIKSKNAETLSHLKQIGAAVQIAAADNSGKLPASLDALTNELGSDRALTDTVSGRRFVYVAGGAKLDDLQNKDVLAYSPEDKKSRAVLFADGSVQRVRRDEFSELTNRGQPALAENSPGQKLNEMPATLAVAAPAPVAAPPAAGAPAGIGVTSNGTTASLPKPVPGAVSTRGELAFAARVRDLSVEKPAVRQSAVMFKTELTTNALQSGLNHSQRFVQTAPANNSPVLASFEVRQNGNAISVVDQDGSVYNGTLQPVEAEPALAYDLAKAQGAAARRAGFSDATHKALDVDRNAPSPAQNYFFRVAGANRSLKQNVVFVGSLIPISSPAVNAAQNAGGGVEDKFPAATANLAPPPLFSNSRIAGTVTVDSTNPIEIKAVPVTP